MNGFVEMQRACATASKDVKLAEKPLIHFKKQLKFLCGYVIGFLMALTTLLFYDRFQLQAPELRQPTAVTDRWHAGRMSALQQSQSNGVTLQQRLADEVRVLCMVLTTPAEHATRAAHVKATWGKRCTRLLFLSSETDAELGAVSIVDGASDRYDLLWHKVRQGFRYVYARHYADYDWFLKADDDTYVIMENLRYSLYAYQPETPVFFGYELMQQNVTYMSGGAGYVLSREALRRAVTLGFKNSTLCAPANFSLPEDYSMSVCLQNVGALPVDGRSTLPNESKQKMFPLRLYDFMNANNTLTYADWLERLTPYDVDWGLDCCSNYSISFHYADAAEMYMYDFLIYNLRAVGLAQSTAVLPKKINVDEYSSRFASNGSKHIPWMPLKWVDVS